MMYRCLECGNLFEEGEQAEWVETHGLDTPPYEELSGCPICKGGYEEVEPCKICGSYAEEMQGDYCKECVVDVQKRFKALMEEFSAEERELLNELYDGEPL